MGPGRKDSFLGEGEGMKKKIDEILRGFTPLVPLGWVLTCCDLGIGWVTERPLEGLWTLVCSTLIAGVLYALGSFAANGEWPGEKKPEHSLQTWKRVRNLLILLAILAWITMILNGAPLPDDVI